MPDWWNVSSPCRTVKSAELGNMVIYDFAGHHQYYTSHTAVLERIMTNSAAICWLYSGPDPVYRQDSVSPYNDWGSVSLVIKYLHYQPSYHDTVMMCWL